MALGSPIPPFDPVEEDWRSEGSSGLAQQICGVSRFLSGLRTHLRFGHLSRSPLRLLNFQLRQDSAECSWIARNEDPWDADLAHDIGRRHASLQALRDAIDIRALLFATVPELTAARLRVYRACQSDTPDLIIVGSVRRQMSTFRSVHSLAMRAKLVGFRFNLENGLLCRLSREEQFGFGD